MVTAVDIKSPGSTDKHAGSSLSIATLIMMGSVFVSRVIGLLREMILAHYGGTSFQMDAYVTAFIIPELLNHFLAGGFLSITFIPIFQRHLVNNREDLAWKAFSNLFSTGTIVFLIVIAVTYCFVPDILRRLGPKINDTETFPLTVHLTRIILPAQLFFFWGALLSAAQMAHKKFFLPALAPLGYNSGIIMGGVLLGSRIGIEGFAWGVIGGACIGNFMLQIPGALRCGMRFRPRWDLTDPDLLTYLRKTLPLILGLGMTVSNEIFFRFFGSFLPEGATSSVNYALRTSGILVAMFGQASGVAFYPYLTRLAAEKKFEEMERMFHSVIKKIAVYLIPLSAVLCVVAEPVISVLYQRGKFTATSTTETAGVFSVYLIGCFMLSMSFIVIRAFYAMQNMVLPMVISTATAVATIPLYIIFSKIFGARGIALAAITGATVQCVVVYALWIQRYGTGKEVASIGALLGKVILVTAGVTLAGLQLRRWIVSVNPFEDVFIKNSFIILCIAPVMLAMMFFLFDRSGIQRFKESVAGLLRRK